MAPRLLPALLVSAGLCWRHTAAEAEPEAEPKLGEPGFVAPNPPSCAVEWADTVTDLAEFGVSILEETGDCAHRLGWSGNSIYGDKRIWPIHHQRRCAVEILASASALFSAISNLEASAFDCFGDNQACGQSIMAAAECLVDAGIALTKASNDCPYVGDNPPWFSNRDLPLKGWACWQDVWRVIQRLVKAAKYIDVAVTTCETVAPEPEPIAGAEGEAEPEPEPEAAEGAEAEPEPEAEGEAPAGIFAGTAQEAKPNKTAADELGANWGALHQPHPFAPGTSVAAEAAVERRLRMAGLDDEDPPMPSDPREIQLALRQFIRAFGGRAAAELPPEAAGAQAASVLL